MNKELYGKVREYRTAVAIVKEMLSKSLITDAEYGTICTVLAGRFGLENSTIFSDMDLITPTADGNMHH